MSLFAQDVLGSAPVWLDVVSRLGIAGVLAILLWFVIVKRVPEMEAREERARLESREERREITDKFLTYQTKRDEQIVSMMHENSELMHEIKRQNAMIIGKLNEKS